MLASPQFWITVSFILFIIAVFKPIKAVLTRALDARAAKIQEELDEALKLKEKAQALLASYQVKQKDAAEEAEKIIKNAREESARIVAEAEHDLEDTLNSKIQIAMQKIANYEQSVMQEVRMNTVNIAISTVKKLAEEQLGADVSKQLVDKAIGQMSKELH